MVATAAARPEPSQALRLAPGPADGTREAPGPLTFPSLRFPVCTVGVMISRAQAAHSHNRRATQDDRAILKTHEVLPGAGRLKGFGAPHDPPCPSPSSLPSEQPVETLGSYSMPCTLGNLFWKERANGKQLSPPGCPVLPQL